MRFTPDEIRAARHLRRELRSYARTRRYHTADSSRSVALGCFLGALHLARNCKLISSDELLRWDRRLGRAMTARIVRGAAA